MNDASDSNNGLRFAALILNGEKSRQTSIKQKENEIGNSVHGTYIVYNLQFIRYYESMNGKYLRILPYIHFIVCLSTEHWTTLSLLLKIHRLKCETTTKNTMKTLKNNNKNRLNQNTKEEDWVEMGKNAPDSRRLFTVCVRCTFFFTDLTVWLKMSFEIGKWCKHVFDWNFENHGQYERIITAS